MVLLQQFLRLKATICLFPGLWGGGQGHCQDWRDFLCPPCELLGVVASFRDGVGHLLQPARDCKMVTLCREGKGILGERERGRSVQRWLSTDFYAVGEDKMLA